MKTYHKRWFDLFTSTIEKKKKKIHEVLRANWSGKQKQNQHMRSLEQKITCEPEMVKTEFTLARRYSGPQHLI